MNKLFLSTRIARQRAKKRRVNDGIQKTGELQSFHSYIKPGPGVRVPTYADNFFPFLILQCSYIHKLCPWGGLPTFPKPVFLLPSFQSILHSRGLFCKYCCVFVIQETIIRSNISYPAFPKGSQDKRLFSILISLKFYDLRDHSNWEWYGEC